MEIAISAVFVLMGMAVGSFLNVVIDRLPAGQSLAYPPSHCPACKKPLAVKDLVPVLSYGLLGGKCRYCRVPIPIRLTIVEAATGLAFGLIYWFGQANWHMSGSSGVDYALIALVIVYFCLLLVISVIDLDHQLILNRLIYPAAVLALIVSIAHTYFGFTVNPGPPANIYFIPYLSGAAIGFGVALALFLLISLLSRGGMGLGDVKMAALMGLMLGIPNVFVGIFLGILAGGAVAIALLAAKKKGRKQAIPFGPFLALGTLLALFWGSTLFEWYRGLFKF